jgi:signal transduction histidine kinase
MLIMVNQMVLNEHYTIFDFMKNKAHTKWLVWLMLLSEMMIIVLVGQWLIMQYNNAHDTVNKQIANEFSKSEKQFIDSVLVRALINPIIKKNESIKQNIKQIKITTDQQCTHDNLNSVTAKLQSSGCDSEKITDDDSDANSYTEKEKSISEGIGRYTYSSESSRLKKKLVMQGTELIVREVCQIADSNNCFTEYFMKPSDTTLFTDMLKKNISKLGLQVAVKWKNSNNQEANETSLMMMQSEVLPQLIAVIPEGLLLYLIKKIASQLLFGLLLIVLSCITFWLAFIGIRNQMQMNILKSDLISNISHELKTPVSTVKLALEAFQNPKFNINAHQSQEYLQMAWMEVCRLELLIEKVMNTALLQNHNHLINKETTDLKQVLAELLESLQVWIKHKNALVKLIAPNDVYEATVDVLHVEGVVRNLLDNSFKYADKSTIVSITLLQNEKEIIISFADNGPGIAPEYLNKVFDNFFRVPKGNRHTIKGYGLGLSYAALVVKQHGGKISVNNNDQGGGCTFELHFPKN